VSRPTAVPSVLLPIGAEDNTDHLTPYAVILTVKNRGDFPRMLRTTLLHLLNYSALHRNLRYPPPVNVAFT
jgi:hypothetical protein